MLHGGGVAALQAGIREPWEAPLPLQSGKACRPRLCMMPALHSG